MNSLELSNAQKSHLLEICKKLFPRYSFEIIDWSGGDHRDSVLYLRIENGDEPILDIHWFEFCIMYLATKLYNLNNRSEISTIELYRGNLIQNYHPVDYLYKEYLFYKNE